MAKSIKVKFIDFFPGHNPKDDLIYQFLCDRYEVILSEEPDYIVDGGFGHVHFDPSYSDCVKLVSIGENYAPDFNLFDYAIGFDDLSFKDRYLRMPLFVMYGGEFSKLNRRVFPPVEALLSRKFCSFVVSDGRGDPCRVEFFKRLSKYKSVASGGAVLNNVGGCIPDKAAFCSQFKFNIAFENSIYPGYTTEKIMQALSVNSVPIYYGDPDVMQDYRPECFIHLTSREKIDEVIERVIYLDTHDEEYLAMCKADCLVHPVSWYHERLRKFLYDIFDQPKEQARRLARYGNQVRYRSRYYRLHYIDDLWRKPALFALNLKRKVRSLF